MKLGLDNLRIENLRGLRVGLLAHKASVTSAGVHIFEHLVKHDVNITAIFGPEHGVDTAVEYMVPVGGGQKGDATLYSLYGDSFGSLKPTKKMFGDIDVLVVDLQDVGSRYYTYIYTLAFAMQTAAETDKKVIVCDRPNPINGVDFEGGLIQKGFESFVGLYPLPNRHGMTIGEIANYFNEELGIGCDLEVVKMQGWSRDKYFDEIGVGWINPSPNMRSVTEAILYPGMCLLEGTNVSEGRGTETPFELAGAPFVNGKTLAEKMNAWEMPGIKFHATTFWPTKDKWLGKKCSGVKFEIADRKTFKPYHAGLTLIKEFAKFEGFAWRTEEYEFVKNIPAIDLLTGSDEFRKTLRITAETTTTPDLFLKKRKKHLLY